MDRLFNAKILMSIFLCIRDNLTERDWCAIFHGAAVSYYLSELICLKPRLGRELDQEVLRIGCLYII